MSSRYGLNQLISQLEQSLEVEYTFYDVTAVAKSLIEIPAQQQRFVLDWIERSASINTALAFQFAEQSVKALHGLGEDLIEAWLTQAMDTYDREGLVPALGIVKDINAFEKYGKQRRTAAFFDDHRQVLERFVNGLSGRKLKLELSQSAAAWTDSETIYLPELIAHFTDKHDNYQLYKSMLVYAWAQVRFGSFQVDLQSCLSAFTDKKKAIEHFEYLEGIRLEACISRELPGTWRQMQHVKAAAATIDNEMLAILWHPQANVNTSLALLENYPDQLNPWRPAYQTILDLEAITAFRNERLKREKALVRIALKEFLEEHRQVSEDEPLRVDYDKEQLEFRVQISADAVKPPDRFVSLLTSVLLDFGEIPNEYLIPAGEGEYDISQYRSEQLDPEEVWSGTYHEEGAYFYDEWDFKRKKYKKDWCVLREVSLQGTDHEFYQEVLDKYYGHILSLRRTFERLKGENRKLKQQPSGDEIDLDALVNAWPDWIRGSEMSSALYTQLERNERNIAVAFMVDMSGSTRGWINTAEREALILMAEALNILGDRYAIYGFSGWTRKRCEIYPIKDFDQDFDQGVRQRICTIEPRDYTRMGAPIRHLTEKLSLVDAKIKLLITLSDGRPDDYDLEYRGEYAIEDTRMALNEAHIKKIHAYCITIDQEGKDYLPHLYGRANFTVIDDVEHLPLKISDIYRRLTT